MIAIFATDLAGGFGLDGGLPWGHYPEDMKHFQRITKGKHIVMGYNTWKTLPSLPNREPVVISRVGSAEVLTIKSLDEIPWLEQQIGDEVVLIGGAATLTVAALKSCSKVYHTLICDTFKADTRISDDVLAYLSSREQKILLSKNSLTIREYI